MGQTVPLWDKATYDGNGTKHTQHMAKVFQQTFLFFVSYFLSPSSGLSL